MIKNSHHKKEFETIAWLRFVRDVRWTLKDKHKLLSAFISPSSVYAALARGSDEIEKVTQKIIKTSKNIAALEKELEKDLAWMDECGGYLITLNDCRYPELLKQIDDPPIALFAMGDCGLLENPKIAIVGSRRPTPVGRKVAQILSSNLVKSGIVIVSGMALGIDGCAHESALQALEVSGATIAVMGCGLNVIYPARHRQLFSTILERGLVLSEYPPDTPPLKAYFPQRNRIVSGLSLGVIIVEAAERSGTIITARLAIEQNRELFVVPGSVINPQYHGSHRLIKDGGQLITDYQDVLKTLVLPLSEYLEKREDNIQVENKVENILSSNGGLLQWVNYDSTPVEKIILSSGLTTAQVSSMLLVLEVEGKIAKTDDGGYLKLV